GANLYIEIEPNSSDEALSRWGAKKPTKFSGDFIDRHSIGDESSKIIEGSSDIFGRVGKSITHIGKEIYDSIEELSPDTATIKFGVKINSEVGGIILVKAGIDAEFSISLTWNKAKE
ncbi:hypothetical protein GSY74_07480, partial [Sulfurovum sp. bin170]|uniref:CU044_2847 family protein n=1 Tax=Sulfurovum sp. bin170 TaxID=2695268 RepID=UPI001417BA2E